MIFKKLKFRYRFLAVTSVVFVPFFFFAASLVYFHVNKMVKTQIERNLKAKADLMFNMTRMTASAVLKTKAMAVSDENLEVLAASNDFRDTILNLEPDLKSYVFILHTDGSLLVHPTLAGINFLKQINYAGNFIPEMLEKKTGIIHYEWQNPGDLTFGKKVVIYKVFDDFNWIVAYSNYASDVYAPLKSAQNVFWAVSIVLFVTGAALLSFAAYFAGRPIEAAARRLEHHEGGSGNIQVDENAPPEVKEIEQQFLSLFQELEKSKKEMDEVVQKNIESQTALVENDLKLRSLFDQSFQYIGLLSPFGILEQVNQRLLDFSGTTLDEIIYKPFWEACWWDHDPEVRARIKTSVIKAMGGEFIRYETTALSADDRIRHMDISIKPVLNTSQDVAFIIAESRDITDFRFAAQAKEEMAVQLERAQKMEAIGTLAGGIAHDFNNILSGILGYSQLLELSLDNPKKARSHIRQIGQGAQRAAELIQQILTFSRQASFERHPLKLYLVIKEALKLMRSTIPTTIDIEEIIASKEKVLADPTQIHQVIMNLCTNAYHAMTDSGGVLTVKLENIELINEKDFFGKDIPAGEYLRLEVSDTGHGMEKETLSKAFDPYFTTKEMGKGTGFGLSLVHAIVEEHDGFIQVESRKDEGASFYIYLPMVSEIKDQPRVFEGSQAVTGGSETVMIVDDESNIRQVFELYLEALGYKVMTFENGEAAIEAFKENPDRVDLIVTDMTMPKKTGEELARQAIECRNDIPVILCTGYSESISEEKAIKIGIRRYLYKPVNTKELAGIIRNILDGKDTA